MENSQIKSFTGQVQLLLKTNKDFPQKLKQRLVREANNVTNHFDFIVRLFNERVLCDGSTESVRYFLLILVNNLQILRDASVGFKDMMVQLALMIACSKGVDAIGGLMSALEGSANSQLISGLQSWVKEDFAIETCGDPNVPKEDYSTVQHETMQNLPKQTKNPPELSSSGTKLIDKNVSCLKDDLLEKLERYLYGQASEIVNVAELIAHMVNWKALDEADTQLTTELEFQGGQLTKNANKTACSKNAIEPLIAELLSTNNERILVKTCDLLENILARKKNYPISVKSLANQSSTEPTLEESTALKFTIFEQPALPNELSKLAALKCQNKSAAKGTIAVQFDKEKMIACSTDGTLNLWNWRDGEEESTQIALNVKYIRCFQYDEEMLIVGTGVGAVHLFDGRTFEEKLLVNLGSPVRSLKFVENTLIAITQRDGHKQVWWMEISRSDLQILNPRSLLSYYGSASYTPGVFMNADTSVVYHYHWVGVYDTKSGQLMKEVTQQQCCLSPPTEINTLNMGDLFSTKRVLLAGCAGGKIALWNTSKFQCNQRPVNTFQGHTYPVVSLCTLNGQLLSLDWSGKLLMWSGRTMENPDVTPVPRVLIQSSSATGFVAYDRWLATFSSKDDIINVWSLPDRWLRTG